MQQKGARASRAPPFVVSVFAVVPAVCDQVNQVVPAHLVYDLDEAHRLDPVHAVDHKDSTYKHAYNCH